MLKGERQVSGFAFPCPTTPLAYFQSPHPHFSPRTHQHLYIYIHYRPFLCQQCSCFVNITSINRARRLHSLRHPIHRLCPSPCLHHGRRHHPFSSIPVNWSLKPPSSVSWPRSPSYPHLLIYRAVKTIRHRFSPFPPPTLNIPVFPFKSLPFSS